MRVDLYNRFFSYFIPMYVYIISSHLLYGSEFVLLLFGVQQWYFCNFIQKYLRKVKLPYNPSVGVLGGWSANCHK